MNLLTIDPSIRKPAAALFRDVELPPPLRIDPRGWLRAAHAYVCSSTMDTSAEDLTADRCVAVGAWVAELVIRHRVDLVVVEVPADAGGYAERQARQRGRKDVAAASLAKLNRAIGAVSYAAGHHGAALAEIPPVDAVTERRSGIVASAIAAAGQVDRALARDLVQLHGADAIHSKKVRHRVLQALLGAAGRPLPRREDARDAAWVGLQYLVTTWTK